MSMTSHYDSACQTPRSIYIIIYLKQFPSYSNRKCKKLPFSRTAAHIFVPPKDDPAIITQYVAWMERQFNACETPCSMYPFIFNSFPVIRTASAKKSPFSRTAAHIFVSPGDAPEAITPNVVWMEREFDAYKLSRSCTHLFSTVSQLFEPQVQKIAIFTYRSPHFCFPWRLPCDYHAICCMDGNTIQCLRNPSQHVPIYLQWFSSYTMVTSMRKSKNRYFRHIFRFPWGRPWGNHAKCCMDGKRIQCLQIASLHVLI